MKDYSVFTFFENPVYFAPLHKYALLYSSTLHLTLMNYIEVSCCKVTHCWNVQEEWICLKGTVQPLLYIYWRAFLLKPLLLNFDSHSLSASFCTTLFVCVQPQTAIKEMSNSHTKLPFKHSFEWKPVLEVILWTISMFSSSVNNHSWRCVTKRCWNVTKCIFVVPLRGKGQNFL